MAMASMWKSSPPPSPSWAPRLPSTTTPIPHTINGTEYNDAYKFFRDDAGVTEDYNFTWYLDQYGNVIGATGITSNYAVLKDMIWVNGGP